MSCGPSASSRNRQCRFDVLPPPAGFTILRYSQIPNPDDILFPMFSTMLSRGLSKHTCNTRYIPRGGSEAFSTQALSLLFSIASSLQLCLQSWKDTGTKFMCELFIKKIDMEPYHETFPSSSPMIFQDQTRVFSTLRSKSVCLNFRDVVAWAKWRMYRFHESVRV